MMQKLSILLSAYNAERYVGKAINSILSQSFSDFELLLADDSSEDRTKEIMDSFSDKRIRLLHNKENEGKVVTCNRLLLESKGEYISIHDADDWSETKRFEKQIGFLIEHPQYVMCGCDYIQFNDRYDKIVHMPTKYSEIINNLPITSQFHGPTLVFRKDILSEIGGLFREFTWGEDIDFTARVVEKYKATNIEEPLYHYRIHDKSLTNDLDLLTPERYVNPQLRAFLADQRRERGSDCLMDGNEAEFEAMKQKLISEFVISNDDLYWRFSQRLLLHGLTWKALHASLMACKYKASYKNIKNSLFILSRYLLR